MAGTFVQLDKLMTDLQQYLNLRESADKSIIKNLCALCLSVVNALQFLKPVPLCSRYNA